MSEIWKEETKKKWASASNGCKGKNKKRARVLNDCAEERQPQLDFSAWRRKLVMPVPCGARSELWAVSHERTVSEVRGHALRLHVSNSWFLERSYFGYGS